MKRKYGYVAIAFLAVAFVVSRLSFCLAQTGGVDIEKLREEIKAYAQKSDHAAVIKLGEEYIKADPRNIEVLIALTESYLSSKDFAKAEETVKKALAVGSDNIPVLTTATKSKRVQAEQSKSNSEKQKLLDSAQKTIAKAIKLAPDHAWVNAEAALVYLMQGKEAEAAKAIKKAINAQPNEPYIKDIERQIKSASSK